MLTFHTIRIIIYDDFAFYLQEPYKSGRVLNLLWWLCSQSDHICSSVNSFTNIIFMDLIHTNFYLSSSSQLSSKRGNYFWGIIFLVCIIYNISIAENVLCYYNNLSQVSHGCDTWWCSHRLSHFALEDNALKFLILHTEFHIFSSLSTISISFPQWCLLCFRVSYEKVSM